MEALYIIIGFALGGLVMAVIFGIQDIPSGTLKIDHSNPDKDIYRMEFDNLDNLSKKKHVILKVDNHADLSQK